MGNFPQIWLKTIGTGDEPLPDFWVRERPDLLSTAHFVQKPSGIARGDLLVYYAAGWKRLFAVVRATEPGAETTMQGPSDQKHWPYMLHVQSYLAVPQLKLAPKYDVLGKPSSAVMQKSHLRLTGAEYCLFLDAVTDRVRPVAA